MLESKLERIKLKPRKDAFRIYFNQGTEKEQAVALFYQCLRGYFNEINETRENQLKEHYSLERFWINESTNEESKRQYPNRDTWVVYGNDNTFLNDKPVNVRLIGFVNLERLVDKSPPEYNCRLVLNKPYIPTTFTPDKGIIRIVTDDFSEYCRSNLFKDHYAAPIQTTRR